MGALALKAVLGHLDYVQAQPITAEPGVTSGVTPGGKGTAAGPRTTEGLRFSNGSQQPSAPGTVLPRSSEGLAGRVAPCWCRAGTVCLAQAERASFGALGPPEPSTTKGFPWIREPLRTGNCHENLGLTLLAAGCWDRCHSSPVPGKAFLPIRCLRPGLAHSNVCRARARLGVGNGEWRAAAKKRRTPDQSAGGSWPLSTSWCCHGDMQARGCQIFRYFKNSLKSGLCEIFQLCRRPSSHLLESLCLFCFYLL